MPLSKQALSCPNAVHDGILKDLAWLVESQAEVRWDSSLGKHSATVTVPDGRTASAWSWRKCVTELRGDMK